MIATRRRAPHGTRTSSASSDFRRIIPQMVGSSKFRRSRPFSSTRPNVISHLAVGTEAELAEDRKKHTDSKVGAKVKGERVKPMSPVDGGSRFDPCTWSTPFPCLPPRLLPPLPRLLFLFLFLFLFLGLGSARNILHRFSLQPLRRRRRAGLRRR